jgi:hypothetical protein
MRMSAEFFILASILHNPNACCYNKYGMHINEIIPLKLC